MNRLARGALVVAVATASALAGWHVSRAMRPTAPEANVSPDAGAALLALTLPDANGATRSLAEWDDRVRVVNFWATWCPPCLKELPDFAAVSRQFSDAPVQFVGISIDSAERVREFAQRQSIPYPLLIGSMETLGMAAAFGNQAQALPFTVIFDRDGQLRHVRLGTLNAAELEGKIRALLPR